MATRIPTAPTRVGERTGRQVGPVTLAIRAMRTGCDLGDSPAAQQMQIGVAPIVANSAGSYRLALAQRG